MCFWKIICKLKDKLNFILKILEELKVFCNKFNYSLKNVFIIGSELLIS